MCVKSFINLANSLSFEGTGEPLHQNMNFLSRHLAYKDKFVSNTLAFCAKFCLYNVGHDMERPNTILLFKF